MVLKQKGVMSLDAGKETDKAGRSWASKGDADKWGKISQNPTTFLSASRSPRGLEEKLVMVTQNLKHGTAIWSRVYKLRIYLKGWKAGAQTYIYFYIESS